MSDLTESTQRSLSALKKRGVLLMADAKLPSVVSAVNGTPIPGSWWQAPDGKLIYNTANRLEAHKDVVVVKLLSGKLTFVHRKLWPVLFAIGSANEPWQTGALTQTSRSIFKKLEQNGELFTDALVAVAGYSYKEVATAAKQFEQGLLAISQGFRVAGKHHRHLQSWHHWAMKVNLTGEERDLDVAKAKFEEIAKQLIAEFKAKLSLPWPKLEQAGLNIFLDR